MPRATRPHAPTGLRVVTRVHDQAVGRSGLSRVHDLANAGEVDVVIVWSLDRLGRTRAALREQVVVFALAGVQIIFAYTVSRATGSDQAARVGLANP